MNKLESTIKELPHTSGIYLFYNSKKELIYVGKATDLKSRVSSYFRHLSSRAKRSGVEGSLHSAGASVGMTGGGNRPIEQMIEEVKDIKTIETDSVLEAIILEGKYIKTKQPKYNVDWKDDKSWNYIYITNDHYPKVLTIREHELKKSDVRGQMSDVVFGPYPGLKVKEMMRLLQKLFFISVCSPPKKILKDPGLRQDDMVQDDKREIVTPSTPRNKKKPCFYYQLGQCLGVCTGEISPAEYKKKVITPLKQFLKGNKKSLLKSLEKKMKEASKDKKFEEAGRLRDQIKNLQKIQDIALLNKSFVKDEILNRVQDDNGGVVSSKFQTTRIEGYDISNLGPVHKVGSMVMFVNGEPKKSEYKKFNIKKVIGQSDVDCLAEVIERRLNHFEWPFPDLFLIDGGVPQVNKVKNILKRRKISIPVIGIAKGTKRKKNEFIFDKIDKKLLNFISNNKLLLIQVRDEAHRFAIKFNRSKRKINIKK